MVSAASESRVASTTILALAPLSLSECARTIAPNAELSV